MQSERNPHPTADELEKCLFNRISEDDRRTVEEHLLFCDGCRDALQDIHATVLAHKWALEDLERAEPVPRRKWLRFVIPAPAYAACAVAVIALFSLTYVARNGAPVPESQVSLTATRSGVSGLAAYAAAGSRLTLNLDTTSLPPTGRYFVEAVDLSGARVWGAEVDARTPALTVHVKQPLQAGRYWVRLNDISGSPLREFELRVK